MGIEITRHPPAFSPPFRAMMAEPLRIDGDGWIALGDAPGFGYAPDERALARTRTN